MNLIPDTYPPRYPTIKLPEYSRAIWILGKTGAGKSSYAKQIVGSGIEPNPLKIVECGRHARLLAKQGDPPYVVSHLARAKLQENGLYFADCIEDDIRQWGLCLVVGARNPTDFGRLFNPNRDAVVMLRHPTEQMISVFDGAGLHAIQAHIDFLEQTGSLERERNLFYPVPYPPAR